MGFFGDIVNIFENGINTKVFDNWSELWKDGEKLAEKKFNDAFNEVKAFLINILTLIIVGFLFFIALILLVV